MHKDLSTTLEPFLGKLLCFDIAESNKNAVIEINTYVALLLPLISNHLSDWLIQGLKFYVDAYFMQLCQAGWYQEQNN